MHSTDIKLTQNSLTGWLNNNLLLSLFCVLSDKNC